MVGLGFQLGTGDNEGVTKLLASVGALYVLYLAWKLATSEISTAPKVGQVASVADGFLLLVFKIYLPMSPSLSENQVVMVVCCTNLEVENWV